MIINGAKNMVAKTSESEVIKKMTPKTYTNK